MSRTPAKFTQADLARAVRAAESCGKSVKVLPDGSFQIVEKGADVTPEQPVDAIREFRL